MTGNGASTLPYQAAGMLTTCRAVIFALNSRAVEMTNGSAAAPIREIDGKQYVFEAWHT